MLDPFKLTPRLMLGRFGLIHFRKKVHPSDHLDAITCHMYWFLPFFMVFGCKINGDVDRQQGKYRAICLWKIEWQSSAFYQLMWVGFLLFPQEGQLVAKSQQSNILDDAIVDQYSLPFLLNLEMSPRLIRGWGGPDPNIEMGPRPLCFVLSQR